MPPRARSRLRAIELIDRFFKTFHEIGIECDGFEPFWGKRFQHFDRIVICLAPQRVIQPPEDVARHRIPTPPQIGGKLSDKLRKGSCGKPRHAAAPRADSTLL